MITQLHHLRDEALAAIARADAAELEALRTRYLGRKGSLNQIMAELPKLPAAEKPAAGKLANQVKLALAAAFDAREQELATAAPAKPPSGLDITLPGTPHRLGSRHPITQVGEQLVAVFARLGFETAYGPEIEDEYHNFEALNIPADHPARDGFDTFYLARPEPPTPGSVDLLLRSHTSPVQVRTMETRQPPIRVVVPGYVFRPDTADASHSPMFFQLEGLAVDKGITFADLKAVLGMAMQDLFAGIGRVRTRFRPSFFPFTEPSAEVDISCPFCDARGCSICKQAGWIELLGAGMVHPAVFQHVGYDPETYTGFAFGIGVDRAAMLQLGINDIRLFYENDIRFLQQF